MNPPGSVSRVSVREPSNYEKVDSFTNRRGPLILWDKFESIEKVLSSTETI